MTTDRKARRVVAAMQAGATDEPQWCPECWESTPTRRSFSGNLHNGIIVSWTCPLCDKTWRWQGWLDLQGGMQRFNAYTRKGLWID